MARKAIEENHYKFTVAFSRNQQNLSLKAMSLHVVVRTPENKKESAALSFLFSGVLAASKSA